MSVCRIRFFLITVEQKKKGGVGEDGTFYINVCNEIS